MEEGENQPGNDNPFSLRYAYMVKKPLTHDAVKSCGAWIRADSNPRSSLTTQCDTAHTVNELLTRSSAFSLYYI